MAIIFYVDGSTKTITTAEPNMTNKHLIEVILPENIPMSFLLTQLTSLNSSLYSAANSAVSETLIIKITYGLV